MDPTTLLVLAGAAYLLMKNPQIFESQQTPAQQPSGPAASGTTRALLGQQYAQSNQTTAIRASDPLVAVHPEIPATRSFQPIASDGCIQSPMQPKSIRDPNYFRTTGSAYPGCQPVVFSHLSMGPSWSDAQVNQRIGLTADGKHLTPGGPACDLLERLKMRGRIPDYDCPETTGKEPFIDWFFRSLLIAEANMVDPRETPVQSVGKIDTVTPMRAEFGYPVFSDAGSIRAIRLKMLELAHTHPEIAEGDSYTGSLGSLWGSTPDQIGVVATKFEHWNKFFTAVTGLPGPLLEIVQTGAGTHSMSYITLPEYWESRNVTGFGSPDDDWWNWPGGDTGMGGLLEWHV
jgi:hypothetical protein